MVRPPKPNDIKQTIPVRKSNLKPLNPDLEERYRTESPLHKKITSDRLKNLLPSAGTSLKDQIKAKTPSVSQKTKSASPKTSKMSKTLSLQPTSIDKKRESITVSKSHSIKPGSATAQKQRAKSRKPSIKKKSSDDKSDPMNRLLKITETEDQDRTSLPVGEQFITNDGKIKNKLSKIGKAVAGAKKAIKKTAKKPSKDASKNLDFIAKKEDSVASLTTHFRMPYLPSELTSAPNASSKFPSVKKRKTSIIQKKISKSKADDQEDNTKETKNKRKSKLLSSKLLDRVLSSDSVPVFSVREIKHNDSFIISARKLQKSTRERRNSKLDCLKLSERTSSLTRAKTDHLPLKSCLKKTWEAENKIGEHFKTEGKMRLHETFHPTQII